MDEEERQVEQSVGQKTSNQVKKVKKTSSITTAIRKVLAVPILGKIVLFLMFALIILFVIVGTISFFFNMPNMVRDRLAEIISYDLGWYTYTDPASNISDETLIAAALDLMYKGYDLEDYGFVNDETYENSISGEAVGGDQITYTDDTKKNIQSIRSKVLTAYIAADNATYLLANNSFSKEYVVRYSRDLIFQIIKNGDPLAEVDESKYENFFKMLEVNLGYALNLNELTPEFLAKALSETIKAYKVSEFFTTLFSPDKRIQIPNLTEEQILERINSEEDAELNFASGLIVFEGEMPEGVYVAIDRYNKRMIVSVKGKEPKKPTSAYNLPEEEPEQDDSEPVIEYATGDRLETWIDKHASNGEHIYYYNLEGWVTKYSRPYEFSLALHLSTMAPEFAYDIATSSETNAKVVMGMKETMAQGELVLDDQFVFPDGTTADAKGKATPKDPNSPGITRETDVLALQQAYDDVSAQYEKLKATFQTIAEGKTAEFVETIAQQEAEKKAQEARKKAYDYYLAIEKEDPRKAGLADQEAENAYNRERDRVLTIIREDKDFSNWVEDRIKSYEELCFGLAGLMNNSSLSMTYGALKKGDEVLMDRPGRNDGNEVDGSSEDNINNGVMFMKEDDYKSWVNQLSETYTEQYMELLSRYNTEDKETYWYSSNNELGEYEIKIGDTLVFNSTLLSNGDTIADLLALSNNKDNDTHITELLNRIMQENAKEYLMLDFKDEEIAEIAKIFYKIEELYNLCSSIKAVPPQIEFLTYVPYIKRVVNHWFRDLVFVREGTEELSEFNAYIEDVDRTNYQYYRRYFRWSLDPLIMLYNTYYMGDPFEYASGTGYKYNVVEKRRNAIEQINNPRVIDNSAYIRDLINNKEYTIYDGSEDSGNTEKEKINVTKSSINTYATLETLPNETSEILVRNLKELFKDTSLAVDNQNIEEFAEVSTRKSLSNIFPDYKPYVPWPNAFEMVTPVGTQMIYKGRNRYREDIYHYLKAPTNGVITLSEGPFLEFSYRNAEGSLNTLQVEIETSSDTIIYDKLVEKDDVVTAGADIVRIKVPADLDYYTITLTLILTDQNGEKLNIQEYMDVPQRELTAEEIITLHNYIMNEGAGQGQKGHAAIAACAFNRTINPSPDWHEAVDLITTIEVTMTPNGSKGGSWVEKDLRTKLWGEERYGKIADPEYGGADVVTRSILIAIARVWKGYDPTKPTVPMGADSYAIVGIEKGKYQDKKYKVLISSQVYYATDENYGDETNYVADASIGYDKEEWQRRYLIYLCTTIKNSYYFENSEVLDDIIKWAQMEAEEWNRREENGEISSE